MHIYDHIRGFECKMLNWIIIESEKRCILGIYFVLRMNYLIGVVKIILFLKIVQFSASRDMMSN